MAQEIPNLPFTVAIPTTGLRTQLSKALDAILQCAPGPDEILIHVDAPGEYAILELPNDPRIKVIRSTKHIGAGGGRQQLINLAKNNWVASFDDDSWPEHADYFLIAAKVLNQHPEVAVLSGASNDEDRLESFWKRTSTYAGCGCIFVKDWFQHIIGFVPVPCSYGIEEIDVSLQLHNLGGLLITDSSLRIVHQRHPDISKDQNIGAEALSNTILFTCLRIPLLCLPLGIMRVISYAHWLLKKEGARALFYGFRLGVGKLSRFHSYRNAVTTKSFITWLCLSRHSIRASC